MADEELTLLAESERYAVLLGKDLDDEQIYNIELGTVTLHLFVDEWRELLTVLKEAEGNAE